MGKKILRAAASTALGLGLAMPAMAATLPARAPGLWRSVTTVLGENGQPLANAENVVTLSCVDPQTDIKFFISGGSACSSLTIAGGGKDYAIDGHCMQQGRQVHIRESLVYANPQNVALKARLDAATGPVTVLSKFQWQGACLAGMLPGDEGNMVNGVFSKTDNINDSINQ